MNRFGKPTQRYPETSFGEDDDPMYPECIHYTLEYKISAEHKFDWRRRVTIKTIGGKVEDIPHRRDGHVEVSVNLKKRIIEGRDCGEIPKTKTSKDDPCEYCDNNFWDKGSYFFIRSLRPYSKQEKIEWGYVSDAYNNIMCTLDVNNKGFQARGGGIIEAAGSTSYSCTKDWFECGVNKTLEGIITPGKPKKLSFDQKLRDWVGGVAGEEREYNNACKIFRMIVAAEKEDDPECAKCNLICKIVHNTIFGSIGAQTGGKPSHDTWGADCDYIDLPVIGGIFGDACGARRGVQFEKWIDEELNNKTKDPGPPWPEIEECPGCPGCD